MTERVAVYYPGPRAPAETRNVLLFFDAVALLVPAHLRGQAAGVPKARDLIAAGVLKLLSPTDLVTEAAAKRLAAIRSEIAALSGDDDAPARDDQARISWSRPGYEVNPGAADVVGEPADAGLAYGDSDSVNAYLRRDV